MDGVEIRGVGEQEQEILRIMKDSAFTQTEGGFYMQDEEAEYQFLYHVIPVLEELMQIYATTAVKLRVQKNYGGPKVKVEISERTDWLEFRFDLQDIPEAEIKKILGFLREREVVHYQRFGEALMDVQDNVKPSKFNCK